MPKQKAKKVNEKPQKMANHRVLPRVYDKMLISAHNFLVHLAELLTTCFLMTLNIFKRVGKLIFALITLPVRLPYKALKYIFRMESARSKQYNRRRYENDFARIKIKDEQIGFTNQVLYESCQKRTNFYVPAYLTLKVKSIKDISQKQLTGNLSCALIINIAYGHIPEEIVEKMNDSLLVQLNGVELIKLKKDDVVVKFDHDKQNKFLKFTIRKVFEASLIGEPLWAPFDIDDLIVSVTLNTLTIPPYSLYHKRGSSYNPQKEYRVSFNCMRNSAKIPISYALNCVYGIFDLAEKRLETYHTNQSLYTPLTQEEREAIKAAHRQQEPNDLKDPEPPSKVKYYQYTHFVIPVYKYPGNTLSTIFIPIFLLALVSLAVFFLDDMSGQVSAIATLILGYIALIPSIKEKLPPSSKVTIVEAVVFIESMCCLLCLWQSFDLKMDGHKFIWNQSWAFVLSVYIHFLTFIFIVGLFVTHVLVWEPSYNSDIKVKQQNPSKIINRWNHPFCDETFIKYNKCVDKYYYNDREVRSQKTIRPLSLKPSSAFVLWKGSLQQKQPEQQLNEQTERRGTTGKIERKRSLAVSTPRKGHKYDFKIKTDLEPHLMN